MTAGHALTLAEQAAHGNTAVGLVVILVTAALVATLFRRLRLQIIPGYIIAGALVSILGHAIRKHYDIGLGDVENISQFATVLLMFTIGLQLELDSLRRSMISVFGLGITATLAVAVALWIAGMAFGLSAPAALAVGMALSISSTAVLLRVLQERRELHQTHGRLCIGVSIAQDLLSIAMLGTMPAVAAWSAVSSAQGVPMESPDFAKTGLSVLIGIAGVTLLLMIGRYALPVLLEFLADIGSRGSTGKSGLGSKELVLVSSAAIALAAAVTTSLLGFSPELGAFLAGLLLALTPYRTQLAGQLEPLRDLLMAIFFTAVGLGIDVQEVIPYLGPIVAGVVVLMAVKLFVNWAAVWALTGSAPLGAITAIYLGNAGEFSLVLLAAAGQTKPAPIISGGPMGALIAVIVLSLILSPFLFAYAHPLATRMQRIGPPRWNRRFGVRIKSETARPANGEGEKSETINARHVIIAGFGPVGRSLAARLDVHKVPYTVIELNPETIRRQRRLGRSILYGDITNPEVLEAAGAREADAVVITIPDDESTLRAIAIARGLSATTFIACRTGFLSGAFRAYEAGADHAVVEEVVTADAMEKQIFEKLQERRGPDLEPQAQSA